ncbi:MAG TPA: hypothetical protein VKB34_10760 [Povalibacter sp.]|nr:hypothetical protein [Povalibacter sp.]
MWFRSIVVAALLYPLSGLACEWTERHQCKDEIGQLVSYRSEAIEYAFGNVFGALPRQIEIRFVRSNDEQYAKYSGRVAYDAAAHALILPQRFLTTPMPVPLRWAASYWPYYRNRQYQEMFPLIADIDNALWGAVLQENARVHGLSWPHAECNSVDLSKRLPCQMLIAGVAALLTESRAAMFNANAVGRIWPEQFSEFEQRSWRSEREYFDVQRYGGIMLLRPLFSEFGVPSALSYVAQTPFLIEDDNMRTSALRYQERAREVLQGRPAQEASGESDNTRTPITLPASRDHRVIAFGSSRDGV